MGKDVPSDPVTGFTFGNLAIAREQEEIGALDWKWGKREETNKVTDYVPQEEINKTPEGAKVLFNIVAWLIGVFILMGVISTVFDLGKSGFKKGTKYLDNRNKKGTNTLNLFASLSLRVENSFYMKR